MCKLFFPQLLTFGSENLDAIENKGTMISVFGRIVDDPELIAKVKEKKFPPVKNNLKNLLYFIKVLIFINSNYYIQFADKM